MYDWIIEEDIYRLEDAYIEVGDQAKERTLGGLLTAKRNQLRLSRGSDWANPPTSLTLYRQGGPCDW